MEYSKTHCHFCNQPLGTLSLKMCNDLNCFDKYAYSVGANYVSLEINGYKFIISDDGSTKIHEPAPKPVIIKSKLDITPENYLEQVERIKKLQAFS